MQYETYKDIPNLLRKYRKIKGLKQKEVANILGFKSASRISQWEKGMSIPNFVTVLKLSILYHTMVDSLFIDHLHVLRKEIREKEEQFYRTKNS